MADAGAVHVVEDSDLDPGELARRVAELLADPPRLKAMSAASRSLARPDAAERIAAEIRSAAESFKR
jgi:UDP-N-acetylglucosamine:LPS N-acetylglucosamine transferase